MNEEQTRFQARDEAAPAAKPVVKSVQGRTPVAPRPRQMAAPPAGHIVIGQVVGSFGLKGMLKIQPLTDFYERFDEGATITIAGKDFVVQDAELHRTQLRLKLKGITHIDDAEVLRWATISVPQDQRPELEEDEFYNADLLGSTVQKTDGEVIGKLDEIIASPGHDLLRIGEVFIPFIREFVKEVDLRSKVIKVELIPGFLPDEPGEEAR